MRPSGLKSPPQRQKEGDRRSPCWQWQDHRTYHKFIESERHVSNNTKEVNYMRQPNIVSLKIFPL